jgi:hypothetical protein
MHLKNFKGAWNFFTPPSKAYSENYDLIFGKKEQKVSKKYSVTDNEGQEFGTYESAGEAHNVAGSLSQSDPDKAPYVVGWIE